MKLKQELFYVLFELVKSLSDLRVNILSLLILSLLRQISPHALLEFSQYCIHFLSFSINFLNFKLPSWVIWHVQLLSLFMASIPLSGYCSEFLKMSQKSQAEQMFAVFLHTNYLSFSTSVANIWGAEIVCPRKIGLPHQIKTILYRRYRIDAKVTSMILITKLLYESKRVSKGNIPFDENNSKWMSFGMALIFLLSPKTNYLPFDSASVKKEKTYSPLPSRKAQNKLTHSEQIQ